MCRNQLLYGRKISVGIRCNRPPESREENSLFGHIRKELSKKYKKDKF